MLAGILRLIVPLIGRAIVPGRAPMVLHKPLVCITTDMLFACETALQQILPNIRTHQWLNALRCNILVSKNIQSSARNNSIRVLHSKTDPDTSGRASRQTE